KASAFGVEERMLICRVSLDGKGKHVGTHTGVGNESRRGRERDEVVWNQRFLHLGGHYAFHAHACTLATPREKGSVEAAVRYLKSGFWPARRFGSLGELDGQYARWRDEVWNRRGHASGRCLLA